MTLPSGRSNSRTPTSVAIAAMLLAACPSLAMQQDEDDPPLLSGPTVEASAAADSLVRYDFAGEFQRLDRHPAEAALDLVRERFTLDEEASQRIEGILNERRKVLDDLVIDRLDLLIKLSNGGSEADRRAAVAALRRAMAPLAQEGALGDRIREHMAADAAAEHQRLESEYVRAAVADRVELLKAEGGGDRARGLQLRAQAIETLVGLGAEVRGAYERTLVQAGERLEALLASLDLSIEQEGKVRAIIAEHIEKTLLDSAARQDEGARLAVFLRVAVELSPEQRRSLVEYARGLR